MCMSSKALWRRRFTHLEKLTHFIQARLQHVESSALFCDSVSVNDFRGETSALSKVQMTTENRKNHGELIISRRALLLLLL